MAKIERKTQKIFAGNGATDDVAAFGSMITGTPVYTDDLNNLQTTAYTQGWGKAIAANEAPFLEEMNGVQYGFSKQLAYLFQNGVPEYDENTTYYANTSFCQVDGVIYQSLTDDNIGNPVTDTTNWKVFYDAAEVANADLSNLTPAGIRRLQASGVTRNIGEIVISTLPLVDAGLHLLDGSVIVGGGIYDDFVKYIKKLYEENPTANYFTAQEEWDKKVEQYGTCGKFVYDSTANTVRLPKLGNQIYTENIKASAPVTGSVVGNGNALGLTNGTNNGSLVAWTTSTDRLIATTFGYGQPIGTKVSDSFPSFSGNKLAGVVTDPDKSGLVLSNASVDLSGITSSANCYWYIIVANSTKTDIQTDIDKYSEDLKVKADKDLGNCTPSKSFGTVLNNVEIRTVIETYTNNSSWYRLYSDGWCEQGGISGTDGDTIVSVSLVKKYKDTNYNIQICLLADCTTFNQASIGPMWVNSKNKEGFAYANDAWGGQCFWHTSGYTE